MATWWTSVQGKIEKHDGRSPKFAAATRLAFARGAGVPLEECHLYRQDPEKHPDTPDLLPATLDTARQRSLHKRRKP